jgi:hypothetical protein
MAVEMLLRARAGGEVAALPLSFVRRCTANFCDETRLLGAGGSAKVYRAEAAAEDDEEAAALPAFAVKRLNGTAAFRNGTVDGAPSADDGSRARAAAAAGLEHEIEVLRRYRHPHIAALLGVARGPDGDGHEHELCLAYDLGEDGSVAACLADDGRAEQLGWKARVRVAAAVGRALSYLHHHGAAPVFHRDVKSANVVLCAAMSSAKLVDFDRCGTAADHAAAASAAVGTAAAAAAAAAAGGTREYMCPSYLRTGAYDARSEIFSFGMLLLELLTGRLQCTPGGPGAGGGGREDDLFGRFVEEAEEPLLGALDERAGAWPAPVAGELIALALTCAGPRKERPASIRVAVRRLGALEHGAAAPMPGELRQLAAYSDEALARRRQLALIFAVYDGDDSGGIDEEEFGALAADVLRVAAAEQQRGGGGGGALADRGAGADDAGADDAGAEEGKEGEKSKETGSSGAAGAEPDPALVAAAVRAMLCCAVFATDGGGGGGDAAMAVDMGQFIEAAMLPPASNPFAAHGFACDNASWEALLKAREAPEVGASDASAASKGTALATEAPAEERCCIVCFDDVALKDGIVCCAGAPENAGAERHFCCDVCFEQHVRVKAEEEGRLVEARGGRVLCPCGVGGCPDSPNFPYGDAALSRHVSVAVFDLYLRARARLAESRIAREMEEQFARRLEAEVQRRADLAGTSAPAAGGGGGGGVAHCASLESMVQAHRTHVIEEILTLHCPRPGCHAAFLDFQGCFALTCHGCNAGFCAWCLEDCGRDAHPHVRQCEHNKAPGKDLFGTEEQFKEAQLSRRRKLLWEYLTEHVVAPRAPPSLGGSEAVAAAAPPLTDDLLRTALLKACAVDLTELGIDCAEFTPEGTAKAASAAHDAAAIACAAAASAVNFAAEAERAAEAAVQARENEQALQKADSAQRRELAQARAREVERSARAAKEAEEEGGRLARREEKVRARAARCALEGFPEALASHTHTSRVDAEMQEAGGAVEDGAFDEFVGAPGGGAWFAVAADEGGAAKVVPTLVPRTDSAVARDMQSSEDAAFARRLADGSVSGMLRTDSEVARDLQSSDDADLAHSLGSGNGGGGGTTAAAAASVQEVSKEEMASSVGLAAEQRAKEDTIEGTWQLTFPGRGVFTYTFSADRQAAADEALARSIVVQDANSQRPGGAAALAGGLAGGNFARPAAAPFNFGAGAPAPTGFGFGAAPAPAPIGAFPPPAAPAFGSFSFGGVAAAPAAAVAPGSPPVVQLPPAAAFVGHGRRGATGLWHTTVVDGSLGKGYKTVADFGGNVSEYQTYVRANIKVGDRVRQRETKFEGKLINDDGSINPEISWVNADGSPRGRCYTLLGQVELLGRRRAAAEDGKLEFAWRDVCAEGTLHEGDECGSFHMVVTGAAGAATCVGSAKLVTGEKESKPRKNGAGRLMAPGRDASTLYCSVRKPIPGTDGQCGPTNGPQCDDCKRYQAERKDACPEGELPFIGRKVCADPAAEAAVGAIVRALTSSSKSDEAVTGRQLVAGRALGRLALLPAAAVSEATRVAATSATVGVISDVISEAATGCSGIAARIRVRCAAAAFRVVTDSLVSGCWRGHLSAKHEVQLHEATMYALEGCVRLQQQPQGGLGGGSCLVAEAAAFWRAVAVAEAAERCEFEALENASRARLGKKAADSDAPAPHPGAAPPFSFGGGAVRDSSAVVKQEDEVGMFEAAVVLEKALPVVEALMRHPRNGGLFNQDLVDVNFDAQRKAEQEQKEEHKNSFGELAPAPGAFGAPAPGAFAFPGAFGAPTAAPPFAAVPPAHLATSLAIDGDTAGSADDLRFKMLKPGCPDGGCRVRRTPSANADCIGCVAWGAHPGDIICVARREEVDGVMWLKLSGANYAVLSLHPQFKPHDPEQEGWCRATSTTFLPGFAGTPGKFHSTFGQVGEGDDEPMAAHLGAVRARLQRRGYRRTALVANDVRHVFSLGLECPEGHVATESGAALLKEFDRLEGQFKGAVRTRLAWPVFRGRFRLLSLSRGEGEEENQGGGEAFEPVLRALLRATVREAGSDASGASSSSLECGAALSALMALAPAASLVAVVDSVERAFAPGSSSPSAGAGAQVLGAAVTCLSTAALTLDAATAKVPSFAEWGAAAQRLGQRALSELAARAAASWTMSILADKMPWRTEPSDDPRGWVGRAVAPAAAPTVEPFSFDAAAATTGVAPFAASAAGAFGSAAPSPAPAPGAFEGFSFGSAAAAAPSLAPAPGAIGGFSFGGAIEASQVTRAGELSKQGEAAPKTRGKIIGYRAAQFETWAPAEVACAVWHVVWEGGAQSDLPHDEAQEAIRMAEEEDASNGATTPTKRANPSAACAMFLHFLPQLLRMLTEGAEVPRRYAARAICDMSEVLSRKGALQFGDGSKTPTSAGAAVAGVRTVGARVCLAPGSSSGNGFLRGSEVGEVSEIQGDSVRVGGHPWWYNATALVLAKPMVHVDAEWFGMAPDQLGNLVRAVIDGVERGAAEPAVSEPCARAARHLSVFFSADPQLLSPYFEALWSSLLGVATDAVASAVLQTAACDAVCALVNTSAGDTLPACERLLAAVLSRFDGSSHGADKNSGLCSCLVGVLRQLAESHFGKLLEDDGVAAAAAAPCCRNGHAMEAGACSLGGFCDRCRGRRGDGACWQCRGCDYDVCFSCHPRSEAKPISCIPSAACATAAAAVDSTLDALFVTLEHRCPAGPNRRMAKRKLGGDGCGDDIADDSAVLQESAVLAMDRVLASCPAHFGSSSENGGGGGDGGAGGETRLAVVLRRLCHTLCSGPQMAEAASEASLNLLLDCVQEKPKQLNMCFHEFVPLMVQVVRSSPQHVHPAAVPVAIRCLGEMLRADTTEPHLRAEMEELTASCDGEDKLLGISWQLRKQTPDDSVLLVRRVEENSLATRLGLQQGDAMIAMQGKLFADVMESIPAVFAAERQNLMEQAVCEIKDDALKTGEVRITVQRDVLASHPSKEHTRSAVLALMDAASSGSESVRHAVLDAMVQSPEARPSGPGTGNFSFGGAGFHCWRFGDDAVAPFVPDLLVLIRQVLGQQEEGDNDAPQIGTALQLFGLLDQHCRHILEEHRDMLGAEPDGAGWFFNFLQKREGGQQQQQAQQQAHSSSLAKLKRLFGAEDGAVGVQFGAAPFGAPAGFAFGAAAAPFGAEGFR